MGHFHQKDSFCVMNKAKIGRFSLQEHKGPGVKGRAFDNPLAKGKKVLPLISFICSVLNTVPSFYSHLILQQLYVVDITLLLQDSVRLRELKDLLEFGSRTSKLGLGDSWTLECFLLRLGWASHSLLLAGRWMNEL